MQAKLEMHKNKGDCIDDCKIYLHTNLQNVASTNGIELYEYIDGAKNCDQLCVEEQTKTLIDKIAKDKGFATSKEVAFSRLCSIIDNVVKSIHQEAIDTGEKERNVIGKYDIPLKELCKIVCRSSLDGVLSDHELAGFVRISLIRSFNWQSEIFESELDEEQKQRLEDFVCKIVDLNDKEFLDVMGRITPEYEFSSKMDSLKNICSDRLFEVLFEVISEVNESLDENGLNWKSDKQFFSPSSVSGKPQIIAKHILENPNAAELLREYDWIVGKPDKSIAEIGLTRITNIEQQTDKIHNIMKPKGTGILKIKDKNDGNYPTSDK